MTALDTGFEPGHDRAECPACGTHNRLGDRRCWNCLSPLEDARRIAFHRGTEPRPRPGAASVGVLRGAAGRR